MSKIPVIHTTEDELKTERFWAEHLAPIAAAHGLPAPDEMRRDAGDPTAHLLLAPDGELLAVVRTGRPACDGVTEQITIPKLTVQILFDALVHSMDFGSGFLDSEEVEALRGLAVAIGVDPRKATPIEFESQYPHAFKPNLDPHRQRVPGMRPELGPMWEGVITTHRETDTEVIARLGGVPRDGACAVGRCGKPAGHPIHAATPKAAETGK